MWEYFLNFAISTLLSELLRPKAHFDRPKPAGLGDFTFPTSSEDRAIPVPWGTVKQEALNLLGDFDLQSVELTQSVRTGLFSKESQHLGYKYYLGMQMGLCVAGVDQILEVWAGDTKVYSGTATANSVVQVSGSWKEGEQDSGVSGQMAFHSGDTVPDAYVGTQVTINPNYKHMTYVVWRGPSSLAGNGYVGINPSIRPFSFVLRRLPKVVRYGVSQADSDAYAAVGQYDANLAFCALEALCNDDWGAGIPHELVDVASFVAAASRLKTEGNGLSMLWDSPRPVGEIVGEMNKQANGTLFANLSTGLIEYRLLRDTDIVAFEFNEDNVVRLESFTRAAADESTNSVRMPFTDIVAGFVARAAVAQDLGGIEMAGQIIPATVQYPGVSSRELAVVLASRDLRMASSALAKVSIRGVLPAGKFLHPGDLVKLTWSPLGFTSLGMRVLSVRYADSGKGEVSLDLVQDIFLPGVAIYAASVPALTADTGLPPAPGYIDSLGTYLAPYALTKSDPDRAVALVFAPDVNTTSYDLAYYNTDPNLLEYDQRSGIGFAAKGTLLAPMLQSATTGDLTIAINAANAATLKRYGGRSVVFSIDDEMFQASAILVTTNDTRAVLSGITRAIWDTVPQAHSTSGIAVLWCDYAIDPAPLKTTLYKTGLVVSQTFDGQASVYIKAKGRNARGAGSFGATGYTSDQFKTGGIRAALPYPPGNLKFAGTSGTGLSSTGTPMLSTGTATTLSFAPRSRQAGGLSAWSTGDFAGETAVSHEIVVRALVKGAWVSVTQQVCAEGVKSITVNLSNLAKPTPLEVSIVPVRDGVYGKSQVWYWTVTG
jgi:hypothetical protein